jgi:hypothetical protein
METTVKELNGNAARFERVRDFYRKGAEFLGARPGIEYLSDKVMTRFYPGWADFSGQVQWSRRTEWNAIRIVAQRSVKDARRIIDAAETKRGLLKAFTSRKNEVAS